MNSKRIIDVKFYTECDDCPDLSLLGKYTDTWEENAIDRKSDDRYGRYAAYGEYRYFVPALTGEETGNPDSPEQDYQRAEAYNRGDWTVLYCYARATVVIGSISQTMRSGGLGGVESDSDASYFEEIKQEELATLRDVLLDCGFTTEQIDEAFAKV